MTSTTRQAIRKAVFPVAGLGTRFLPDTKAMPKELLPIIDKPIIQYAVEEAVAAGITDLLLVTGRTKRAIENHFDANPELERALREKGKDDVADMVRNIYNRDNAYAAGFVQYEGIGRATALAPTDATKDAAE